MRFVNHRYVSVLSGLLAVLLGLAVIAGWHGGSAVPIRIAADLAPMQYNTALGFVLCGAGLVLLNFSKHGWSALTAGIAAALGIATLWQYLFSADLGIDTLFMEPYIATGQMFPGRMAVNTALCFFMAGTAIALGTRYRSAMACLAVTVLFLALLAAAGYINDAENIYGQDDFARMAIHAAVGFSLLAGGIIATVFRMKSENDPDLWKIIASMVSTIVIVVTVLVAFSVHRAATERNRIYFSILVNDTQDAMINRYMLYEQSLWGGVGLINASDFVDRDEWTRYVRALNITQTLPGINGLGYIDYVAEDDLADYLARSRVNVDPDFRNYPETNFADKFIIRYIVPDTGNSRVGFDIGAEAGRRNTAASARDDGMPMLTEKITLIQDNEKRAGFLLLNPVYENGTAPATLPARRENLVGWVFAIFVGKDFLHDLAKVADEQIAFAVYDGEKTAPESLIYAMAEDHQDAMQDAVFSKRTQIRLAGRVWTIEWYTADSFVPPAHSKVSFVILFLGVVAAYLLNIMFRNLLRQREIIYKEVKRRTRELSQTRNRLRMIMDYLPDMVFVKDKDLRIVEANPAFLDIYPPEERANVIGRTTLENFSGEQAAVFLSEDRKAMEAGYSETIESNTDYKGHTRMLMTKKVGFTDADGSRYILGVARDVTEAMETQEQLRISEERFDLAVRAAKIGLWDWDSRSDSFFFNDEWFTILGYEPYELPVRYKTWVDLTHPDDVGFATESLNNHLRGKADTFDILIRMKRKDGDWAWMNVQGQVFERDTDGRPMRVAGIQVDVSELKNKEQEAAKAREEARRASRMKSEFVANISHEIRTPMNGILGMAELLLKSDLKEREIGYTRTLINSAEALLDIINDVLDLSKIEAGRLKFEYIDTNVPELLDDLVFIHSIKAQEKAIELILHMDKSVPSVVVTDPLRLRQILNNLIGNAVKFTESGYVWVKVRNTKGGLHFEVEDTGIGIPKKTQRAIFKKFTQADASTTRKFGGTGLGLAICEQLVQKMNGEIGVKSEPGKGSVFHFTLPADIVQKAETFPSAEGRVLVADDVGPVLETVTGYLKEIGITFDTAANTQEAIARLKKAEKNSAYYDLLIFDSQMPGVESKEFQNLLDGHNPATRLTKILTVPSYESGAYAEEQDKYEAVISKPLKKKEFLLAVLGVFGNRMLSDSDKSLLESRLLYLKNNRAEKLSGPPLKMPGTNILLVDDSPVNQLVTEEILKEMGCRITLASDGEQAIAQVKKRDFDIILMDCRMPVKDGFEATRAIRDLEKNGKAKKAVPIIALTAGAFAEDRERCIDAGMNDYLSKPVRGADLKKKIDKWAGRSLAEARKPLADFVDERLAEAEKTDILDMEFFSEQKDILGKAFDNLVRLYIQEIDGNLDLMMKELKSRTTNKETLARTAHTIKSSSAQCGARKLSLMAGTVEKLCDATDRLDVKSKKKIRAVIEEMYDIYEQTEEELTALTVTR